MKKYPKRPIAPGIIAALKSWVNYHHLFYFKTIAELGSVSKAARALRIGQSTLSAQLGLFERNLGVQLFDRKRKRLHLTERGKVALDYAKSIFRLGQEMSNALNPADAPRVEGLHLSCLDSVPKQVVLSVVKRVQRVSRRRILLTEGRFDELLGLLREFRIDALIADQAPLSAQVQGVVVERLTRSGVGIYGVKKFLSLRRGFPRSLSEHPMILPTYDSKMRVDLERWAQDRGVRLDVAIESQDISVKKLLAIEGLGLIPASDHAVRRQLKAKELYPIGKVDGVHEDLYLITSERKSPDPSMKALRATIKTTFLTI